MLWLTIAVRDETLSIKTLYFGFLSSRIFGSCTLYKVIYSSMKNSVAPCYSGYHYCTTSFNKARTQVLRRFKSCSRRVGDSRVERPLIPCISNNLYHQTGYSVVTALSSCFIRHSTNWFRDVCYMHVFKGKSTVFTF